MDEKKKLYPGDPGYLGGTFISTVNIDGKVKEVTVIKDAYGNITYTSIRDKLLGIF